MKTNKFTYRSIVLGFTLALASPSIFAADAAGEPGRNSKGPNSLKNVYFGEQHLHTSSSADAFAFGTRMTPDDAYRFAQGESLTLATGNRTIKKSTPYDWVAVTDHAVYLGVMPMLLDPNSPMRDTPIGKEMAAGQGTEAFQKLFDSVAINAPIEYMMDSTIMVPAWKVQVDAANKHYKPGKFTTLIAFEWTSQPNYMNLHHNVFFRDDTGPARVFSSFDSEHREDLWTYQEYQRSLGHENFSIPHNSNVSNGAMFAVHNSDGDPIDVKWAERSARNSPAVEIIQTKGASETNPAVSPSDEFAGFEQGFKHRLASGGLATNLNRSFVRNALTDGAGFKEMLGVNPFKYGIVAGADIHIAASTNEEFNFHGAHGNADKSAKLRMESTSSPSGEAPIQFGSAGTTAVWAPENTREAIFDGIRSKETYGTSGTLIRVRFFGGWDYDKNLVKDKNFVKTAYKKGVPMGGDLAQMPKNAKAPTFVVWAMKDPESGNLDRVQIVKVWAHPANGLPVEKIYDVAWSDNRKPDAKTGKLPPVGNTVDIKKATYTNDIGDTQLSAMWTDPDFKPETSAAYYVRVLEIPTPRWSTYDAARTGLPIPEGVPLTLQERAWSSPSWFTPEPNVHPTAVHHAAPMPHPKD